MISAQLSHPSGWSEAQRPTLNWRSRNGMIVLTKTAFEATDSVVCELLPLLETVVVSLILDHFCNPLYVTKF